jgi:hypothetical protein
MNCLRGVITNYYVHVTYTVIRNSVTEDQQRLARPVHSDTDVSEG